MTKDETVNMQYRQQREMYYNELPGDDEDIKELILHPGVLFLFCVSFPCWVHHQTSVEDLLEQVRGGDIEALEKLLRLNRKFIENPDVLKLYYHAKDNAPKVVNEDIDKAMNEGITKRLELQSMKYLFAAFVLQLSKKIDEALETGKNKVYEKHRKNKSRRINRYIKKFLKVLFKPFMQNIKYPSIQPLFDVVERERTGKQYDQDLARSPNGFRSSMKPYIKLWEGIDIKVPKIN